MLHEVEGKQGGARHIALIEPPVDVEHALMDEANMGFAMGGGVAALGLYEADAITDY